MNVSMSYEDDPLGDWQITQGARTDTVINQPQEPLTLGVSPQCLLLLRMVAWGAALLAVALTGWLIFVPGPRA